MRTEEGRRTFSAPHLNPRCMGLAFGATGLVFYLGCMLTMATVPLPQVALGLVTTFILGWFEGVLIAGIYNLCLRMGK